MKKVLNHLKENWIRHGFETLVVVVGILVAFALNNWKERRQEMTLEIEALIELKEEFYQNKLKLEESIRRKEMGLQSTARVLDMIKEGNVDFANIPINAGLYTHNPSFGVLDKLQATGKIDYIQNDSLRILLSNWKEQLTNYTENEEWHINFVFEQLRPIRDRLLPVPALDPSPVYQQWDFYDSTETIQFFENAFSDLEFQNSLMRNYQRLNRQLISSDGAMASLNRILVLLDSEIDK